MDLNDGVINKRQKHKNTEPTDKVGRVFNGPFVFNHGDVKEKEDDQKKATNQAEEDVIAVGVPRE